MLDPNRRRSLCDLLEPPAGFRFSAGVATTYSLDFTSLTAAVRAAAGRGLSKAEELAGEEVLKTIAAVRSRFTIFAEQARICPPPQNAPPVLFALYDTCVRSVSTGNHAFHPKLWLLKYGAESGIESDARYRLICSSRNLTTAATLECGVVLEGRRVRNDPKNGMQLSRYLADVVRAGGGAPDAVLRLIRESARVSFTPPPPAKAWFFCGQRPGSGSLVRRLPAAGVRDLVVVTPFVSAGFLQDLFSRVPTNETPLVISRQSELDCLPEHRWKSLQGRAEWFVARADSPVLDRSMDLHAKIIAFSHVRTIVTLFGSANATAAAWGVRKERCPQNWEAVVELREALSPARLRRELLKPINGSGDPGWVQPYQRTARELSESEEQLRQVECAVSGLHLLVSYSSRGKSLCLRPRPNTAMVSLPAGVRVSIAPMCLDGDRARFVPVGALWPRGIRFVPVAPAEVSHFFTLELSHVRDLFGPRRLVVRADGHFSTELQRARDTAALDFVAPGLRLIDLLLERFGVDVTRVRPATSKGEGHEKRNGGSRRSRRRGAVLEAVLKSWVSNVSALIELRMELNRDHLTNSEGSIRRLRLLLDALNSCGPRVSRQ